MPGEPFRPRCPCSYIESFAADIIPETNSVQLHEAFAIEPRSPGPRLVPLHLFTSCALLCLAIVLGSASQVVAQGATGAAVQGTVAGASGAPVEDATVLITNTATGERWRTLTHADGRYFLQHLSIGGPYRFDVRAIGFAPAERTGVLLSLGQRVTSDFGLLPAAFQLEEVTVHAEIDPHINAGRTGPALTVTESTIVRLPVDGRDFTRLALLSPQVTTSPNGALSFAGNTTASTASRWTEPPRAVWGVTGMAESLGFPVP